MHLVLGHEIGEFLVETRLDRVLGHGGDEFGPQILAVERAIGGEIEATHDRRLFLEPGFLRGRACQPDIDHQVEQRRVAPLGRDLAELVAEFGRRQRQIGRGDRFAVERRHDGVFRRVLGRGRAGECQYGGQGQSVERKSAPEGNMSKACHRIVLFDRCNRVTTTSQECRWSTRFELAAPLTSTSPPLISLTAWRPERFEFPSVATVRSDIRRPSCIWRTGRGGGFRPAR